MKLSYMISLRLIFLLIFFVCLGSQSYTTYAQTTAIPDENFEQSLIDQGIDSDGTINGQVLTSDIETVEILQVDSEAISDLTGIEDFVALEVLDISNNDLTSLDVSNNIQLKELYVSNYGTDILAITSLDLTNNVNLEVLFGENVFFLEELNLKNGNNEILTVTLPCEEEGEPCELTELDCVMVDDEDAAANDDPPYDNWFIQADFIYSEDCTLGITERDNILFSIYPNPVQEMLFIEKETATIEKIKIYDVSGKILLQKTGNATQINMAKLPSGVFFVKIQTDKGIITKKIIKK